MGTLGIWGLSWTATPMLSGSWGLRTLSGSLAFDREHSSLAPKPGITSFRLWSPKGLGEIAEEEEQEEVEEEEGG